MWIVSNATLPQAHLVDFPRLVPVATKTLPSMLARLARLVSLVTPLMPGLLHNSTSHTPSRELKKVAMVLTMAAHLAEIAILPLYFSRVVSPATKGTILMTKAAKVVGMTTTIK